MANEGGEGGLEHVDTLDKVRALYTAVQGNLIVETDGDKYSVFCPPVEFEVDE